MQFFKTDNSGLDFWRKEWITLIVGLGIVIIVNVDTLAIGSNLYINAAMETRWWLLPRNMPKPILLNPILKVLKHKPAFHQSAESQMTWMIFESWVCQSDGIWIISEFPNTLGGWLTKVLGWVLTAFANSLGAPFWFDLLNKIMVIRSTVRPKEKSPEEPPINR